MKFVLKRCGQRFDVEASRDGERYLVSINGRSHEVRPIGDSRSGSLFEVDGRVVRARTAIDPAHCYVGVDGGHFTFSRERADGGGHAVEAIASPEITAPMPGKVTQLLVKVGDRVATGDTLVILEAMKMENRLAAEGDGVITDVNVATGDMVNGGQVLLRIAYDEAEADAAL